MKSSNRHHSKKSLEINAKWTAENPVLGFRHYRIASIRIIDGNKELELISVIDRSVRFFISIESLKKDSNWKEGWL